jgi:NADH-quinone oxidoreductase subunit I
MLIIDIMKKVLRVSKALTQKSPAQVDVRYEAMHHPARYRGEHRINYETCIGCDSCNKICPTHAITMKKLPFKKQNIVPEVNLSVCIFCGLCEEVCPTKPEKSIVLSGGRYDMLSGGWHEDQNDFWVHVDIPQSYIDSRLEAEEAARVKKELAAKKKEAEAKAKAEAEAKGESLEEAKKKKAASDGTPDFTAGEES